MEAASTSNQNEEWKKRVFLGELPQNFLRLEGRTSQQQQEAADHEAALALHQIQGVAHQVDSRVGRLSVTVVQAKLVKNYGMTRMDPYVRLRVGHSIYETQTATNGGKNPHWNKVIQCWLPPGVNQIYIEIYDECSFTMDELIAWGHIEIPPQVIQGGDTHEDWYMLSGKQGDNQEGMINLVLSYTMKCQPHLPCPPVVMVPSATSNLMFGMPGYAPVRVYSEPPVTVMSSANIPSSAPQIEIELKQIAEMFPNIDKDVIKSVYDANNGKKEATINILLQMVE